MLSLSLNATHASFAAVSLAVLACTHAAAGPVVYTCSYMRDKELRLMLCASTKRLACTRKSIINLLKPSVAEIGDMCTRA